MIAISQADRTVKIQSPYFVPDQGMYDAMINAALSGVDLRFMMTGMIDKKLPFWAAQTYYEPLLRAGAHVYLYEAGFFHAKTIAVDSQICAVGTMNMDIRSLRLHKELMLWMFDQDLTRQLEVDLRARPAALPRDDPGRRALGEPLAALSQLLRPAVLVRDLKATRATARPRAGGRRAAWRGLKGRARGPRRAELAGRARERPDARPRDPWRPSAPKRDRFSPTAGI